MNITIATSIKIKAGNDVKKLPLRLVFPLASFHLASKLSFNFSSEESLKRGL